MQVDTLDEAIALVNSNEHGNGTALFTRSGVAARKFQSDIQVGMVGINVRPAPSTEILLRVHCCQTQFTPYRCTQKGGQATCSAAMTLKSSALKPRF